MSAAHDDSVSQADRAAAPEPIGLAGRLTPSTIHWSVLGLALPALADHSLLTLLLLSDTYLAGHLPNSKEMVSAMGMSGQLMFIINVLLAAVGVGAMALVARAIGEGNREQANRTARQAMIVGTIIGLVMSIVIVALARVLLSLLGLKELALDQAVMFARTVMPALCVWALMAMGGACLRGAGDTRGALWAAGLANIVNILVAWTLVKGWFGLPQLGLRGIAIGTLCAYLCGGLFMLYLVRSGRRGIRVRFRPFSLDRPLIGRMLRIGSFAGGETFIFACASTAIAAFVTRSAEGTAAYAAFTLTIRIEALSYLPGFAFGIAGGALVGQSLGAALPRQASHCGWWAYAWGGLLMAAVGLAFVLWPEPLVHFFLRPEDSPQSAALAVRMLRICGYVQPFLAMIMVFSGCLKGAGDTRYPFAITAVGVLGRIVVAWLLTQRLGLGVVAVWIAMMTDLSLRGVAVMARFLHGGWKKVRV